MSKAIDGKEAIVIGYRLPSVGGSFQLDRRCPDCRRLAGRIHTAIRHRGISDPKVATVPQRRMRCGHCGLTWTLRADGVKPNRQRSERLRWVGVVLYMLGLSYRHAADVLRMLEWQASKSAVERDVAEAAQAARSAHQAAPPLRVRVLGVDGTGAAMAGRQAGMVFFVDVERGKLLCVEPLSETDTRAVRRHVGRVLAAVGAEQLRTDEHSVYEGIVPPERHRLCLAHWRKSKGKRAWELRRQAEAEDRPLEAQTMRQLQDLLALAPRPPTVPPELSRLVGRYINARKGLPWKVNQLLQHVERTWERVSDDPVDPTNNVTERTIGLTYKIRSKTMRGFKSQAKALAHPHLASLLRGDQGLCDLRQVL